MATVTDYFGCTTPQKCYGRKTNSGLLVGIEVELEKVQLLKHPDGWTELKDGSLKDRGMEFTIPVWHTHALEYLKDLFNSVKNPEASSRCSVHIHADVTTFTVDQIKSLIILYTIFERALYRYSGNRWDSNYCVPIQTWAIGMNLNYMGFGDIAIRFMKYSGLNVFPDEGKLGTVEFRHMAGNKNPEYISDWINIIVRLVKYSKNQDYPILLNRINDMRATSQYWELFKDIFGDYRMILNYSTFDKDVEEGITFAKLITE
jgi:hypothetical protein